jgi:hypothetical protein
MLDVIERGVEQRPKRLAFVSLRQDREAGA